MTAILMQVQFLLAAVSAFLPFAPSALRERLGGVLDIAGQAVRTGAVAAREAEDLAARLAVIRRDIETLATSGESLTPAMVDAAFARVAAASAAFRKAAGAPG